VVQNEHGSLRTRVTACLVGPRHTVSGLPLETGDSGHLLREESGALRSPLSDLAL
jgi:hypothetical protein